MVASEIVENDREVGLEFQTGARAIRVLFNQEGEVGGHIRIVEGEEVLVDRALTREVMQQTGMALTR